MQTPTEVLNIGADVAKDEIVVACSEGSFPTRPLANQRTALQAFLKKLPVCVGIADTKTLAKLANHCAKKLFAGKEGVCDFGRYSDIQRSKLFASIPVGDIWGIGRKISEKLITMKIETVEDLRTADPNRIRQQFSIIVERTVNELNGISCIELDAANTPRQQIMVSRSFG